MDSNRPELLHAWLLVHCSPKDAINCITLQLGPEAVTQMVMNLCGRRPYYEVMQMTKRDMDRGRVMDLASIFDPQPPIASLASSSISSDSFAPKSPVSIVSHTPSKTSQATAYTAPTRNKQQHSDFARGFVLSPGGAPDRFCSIGKSNSPYRFVRGDFLRGFGPMHPTAACEELKTYVDFIGYVSSSECVYLTWYNYGSNATHAEKFWIFETENEDACDLLIANRPISGEPVRNPQLLDPEGDQSNVRNFGPAYSFHESARTSARPSGASQSGQTSFSNPIDPFYDAEESRSSRRTQQPAFTSPQQRASSTHHTGEQLEIPLEYFLGRAKLDGSLSLNDHDGSAFLHELSELYAVAYENNPVLDRSLLQVQLTPIIHGTPSDDRVVYLLKQAGFQWRWNKILKFAREQQSCEGFEEIRVQLLQPSSAVQS